MADDIRWFKNEEDFPVRIVGFGGDGRVIVRPCHELTDEHLAKIDELVDQNALKTAIPVSGRR